MQAFKIIQITPYRDHVLALDDVGGIWRGYERNHGLWAWTKIDGPI